ncbi:BRE1-domain-containing protein [Coniochaeta ligniaria NRRL 30616]|uniref:E3 ubiquitin protein ligase n=1 Tax=Coniochaeta ligniaria NRRL 30616 TaxID=1408157 RepID=A0A1J7K180_9PEZI|nr:BRE1-domain-containing protein [Coniochaeta ligniaria NRRL 30616]
MDDRKRPAVSAVDDLAPPSKRLNINGSSKSRDDSGDKGEDAWIEEYQKGAIFRQMLEYKREKSGLEARLQDLEKKSSDHDDHLRIVDAWWLQLLQEIELVVDGAVSSTSTSPDTAFPTSLHFKEIKDFQKHVSDQGRTLKTRIDSLVKRLAAARGDVKPEIAELESQLKAALAKEKEYLVKCDRLKSENERLQEQVSSELLKVIKAERKLDRVRSSQVQKLEQQALAKASTRPSPPEENGSSGKESHGNYAALQLQYQEAIAAVTKQKEQLSAALAEVNSLQEENTTLRSQKGAVSDEEYARSDVFKQFKIQNEDLIRRINNLEATNRHLREEAEKLQADRTSFKDQLEREAQAVTLELEEQIQVKEQDLTRIRSARDELYGENTTLKQLKEEERTALEHLKELTAATSDRVQQLELELERLRPTEDTPMTEPRQDIEALSLQELKEKYLKLEKDFESINKEMPLLEKSYKKTMALASKKVMDFTTLEERVVTLLAEKSKADQKYFAARKDMDIRTAEIRSLRLSNGKSSDIISQLKESEAQSRMLISNLEKQLVDLKQSNAAIAAENKKLEAASSEANRRAESAKAQISELTSLVKSKDAAAATLRQQAMEHETEAEKLKVRVEHISKERDNWKTKSMSNSSSEEEMLRNLVICSVCRINFKNTILKTCGHVFCNECVDNRITNRMRKCPSCSKAFDKSDAMPAHL